METAFIRSAFDKSPYRSRKHSSYFAVYEKLFAPFRGKAITFVEIGVLNGGSLFMWREFFGPDARIIGVDLNEGAKRWERDGFEIFIGNQADPAFWADFVRQVGKIDLALDDGGHTFPQQIITVEALLPVMAEGGLLLVEDTHTSYDPLFGGPSRHSFVEYAKNRVDGINHRSSMIDMDRKDRDVWGVSFYESFVVFHIERSESTAAVKEIVNDGQDLSAEDLRYADAAVVGKFGRMIENYPVLARNRGVDALRTKGGAILRRFINSRRNKDMRKFFRF